MKRLLFFAFAVAALLSTAEMGTGSADPQPRPHSSVAADQMYPASLSTEAPAPGPVHTGSPAPDDTSTQPTEVPFLERPLHPGDFVRTWVVLGPFSNSPPGEHVAAHGPGCYGYHNDLLADTGGEVSQAPSPGDTVTSIAGETRAWELYLSPTNWIDFNSHFSPNDDVVAYAYTVLHADKSTPATLGLAHNDGMKLWLNGELAYAVHPAKLALNSVLLPVKLREGDNRVLVKVDEKRGGWGFALSVRPAAASGRVTVRVPLPAEEVRLQASLFNLIDLEDSEPSVGQPLRFVFPLADLRLPRPLRLPVAVRESSGKPVKTAEVRLDSPLRRSYPLDVSLREGSYRLELARPVPAQPKFFRVLRRRKVFQIDPDTSVGVRPYEMGDRPGCENPLADFEDLRGWWIH
ncbi:MAG TPA: hypothetical protein ENK07_10855, partial [Bacteroidetes bacterium]|nr:hypothetical protein [Bacteroidota bacterium]